MNPILLRSLHAAAMGLAGLVMAFVFALACVFVYLAPSLPTKDNMDRLLQLQVPLRVYTRSGSLVAQIGEQRRIPVKFEDIPERVRQAVLAAEDDRFFQHSGLDWMGVARAVFKTATGSSSQGGSTISQQAARNVFLTLDRTMRRKMSEIFVTWRMERDFTKEQILEIYLNKILFGQRSYGIAAAAETYCGKRLDQLTVAEAAMLAGIIQRPSDQNPITNPKWAGERRAYVLRRMRELGHITPEEAEAAANEPIDSRGYAPLIDVEGPYVAEMVRQEVVRLFGESAVNSGYKVFTTLDDRRQSAATTGVRKGLMEIDRRGGYRGPLGKVELPRETPSATELDTLLKKYRTVAMLEPAVVTTVGSTTAEVHVRNRGTAQITWDGMSWAAKALRNGVGPRPTKAADVLKRGDVVHVITDGRGIALLAQVPREQAALVAQDPLDGAVVALVGGFDFYTNQYNRATLARRQPGSGFKPFLYSAALESGITAATLFLDAPVLVNEGDTEDRWRPQNSDGQWLGDIPLRTALVRSRNTVSIRVLQEVGIGNFIDYASRFGFDPKDMPRNQTLALGSLITTPLRMATGYSVFANGGFLVEPYWIERIEDASGAVVYQAKPSIACAPCETPPAAPERPLDDHAALVLAAESPPGEEPALVPALAGRAADALTGPVALLDPAPPARVFGIDDVPPALRGFASVQGGRGYLPEERLAPRVISAQNAWLMSDILHDVTMVGTARRTRALGRDDLAGKTGTTNEGRDTWFNGFTHDLVATVWVGNDNYDPLGATAEGSNTAVPIWMYFMKEALEGTPSSRMARPPGLVDLRVSPFTGARADILDSCAVVEIFLPGALPREHRTGEPACPGTEAGGSGGGEPLF